MKKDDVTYLCQMVGGLTGVPVKYYKNKKLIFDTMESFLPRDPMILHQEELDNINSTVGYLLTDEFIYYGFIKTKNEQIIIGPSFEVPLSKPIIRSLCFALDLTGKDKTAFEQGLQSITPMPIPVTLQILCALTFALTGEKITIKDITIEDDSQEEIKRDTVKTQSEWKEFLDPAEMNHTTFSTEQALLDFIRNGNVAGLLEWSLSVPSVRPGIIAGNQLRQTKNTFIVASTLASRAAIEGGLNVDDALTLSDLYIQKCEALDTIDRIMNLQYHMIMDYTSQVQSLRFGDSPSALVLKVANYVHQHITEHITTDDLAKNLFLSRGYLSTSFKKETGMSLSNYVMSIKIEEAKRLMSATDKTMSEISTYLGFSSQSHFSSTFQKYEGMTPSEYKERN